MSEDTSGQEPRGPGTESEEVLRGKYLDYCSARVADILLLLTPDEMYVLAQEAARESGEETELSYGRIVELATGRISRKLDLPPFEVWAERYRADPEEYEAELMGLWKSVIRPSDS